MSTIGTGNFVRRMPFVIRPLKIEDLFQSEQIEEDAFPTLFPKTSFRRELKNQKAHYLVAVARSYYKTNGDSPYTQRSTDRNSSNLNFNPLRNVFNFRKPTEILQKAGGEFVVGFVCTSFVVGEAHVDSVGVKTEHRGFGVGELLLIASIEQALTHMAEVATLEVRPSNVVARNLYHKYGFEERGLRKSYYSDNREDAIIMTTEPIQTAYYTTLLQELKLLHRHRWGESELTLS